MNMFLNALILAVLVPASDVQKADAGPACRAEVKGTQLLTVYEMPGGMLVEGPWQVVNTGEARDGRTHFTMFAVLHHVVERDLLTGEKQVIPFPEPVQLAFEGETQREVMQRAAQVWCVTVMRAQENQSLDRISPRRSHVTRVAMIEPTQTVAEPESAAG